MAEPHHDHDSSAPQNPPKSVADPAVRRAALWTYLGPLVLFFAVIGLTLVYRANSPSQHEVEADRSQPRAEGTAGERTAAVSTRDEIESRGGATITELGGVLEGHGRGVVGVRVEVEDVDVERVESPTLFWIRDGNIRVPVVAAESEAQVQAGQTVNVVGVVERAGDTLRIRASRITRSQ